MKDRELFFMEQAFEQAKLALAAGEVPIGAVLVLGDTVVGKGYNSVIRLSDPTAHAEIQALREGGQKIANYRLKETELYVTLEPCMMCYSAMVHGRVKKLIYGADDFKSGIFSTGKFFLGN